MKKDVIKYTIFSTEVGWMGAAVTDDGVFASVLPQGCREDAEFQLLSRLPANTEYSPDQLRDLSLGLQSYFRNRGISCRIDWSWATPFQRRVFEVVISIPFGSVMSYGEVAAAAGNPKAARAVGQAVASNMIPVIIPCHRVIRNNGELGGFTGAGLEVKSRLLSNEGIILGTGKNGKQGI